MLGTSLSELIFIRICVFLLRFSVPCSFTLLIITYAFTGVSPLGIWGLSTENVAANAFTSPSLPLRVLVGFLSAVFVADSIFFLAVYHPFEARASGFKPNYPHPSLAPADRSAIFHKCLDNVPDPAHYLRRWFHGADLTEIRRDNVRDFVAWAFFDRDVNDAAQGRLSAEEEAEMEGYLDEINRRLILASEERGGDIDGAAGLRPGRGAAKSMRPTIDKVPMCFRSIIWYIIVMLVDMFTHFSLLWKGFAYFSTPITTNLAIFPPRPQLLTPPGLVPRQLSPAAGTAYWYRPHKSQSARPVVFIHGVGIGLLPYIDFLSEMANGIPGEKDGDGQIGVIAIEVLPVCMRLAGEPMDKEHFLAEVIAILDRHGWLDDDFTLVSHSYGSVLTTQMLDSPILGPRIDGIVLIDPVSLLLHLPDVAYNFTRRIPRRANEVQLWFAASMDPGTALVLGRHFFWQQNIVWKEQLLQRFPDKLDQKKRLEFDESPLHNNNVEYGGSNSALLYAGDHTATRRKVAVALAGWDIITDTRHVVEYLFCEGELAKSTERHHGDVDRLMNEFIVGGSSGFTHSGIEVIYFHTSDHSHCFDRVAERYRLVRTSCFSLGATPTSQGHNYRGRPALYYDPDDLFVRLVDQLMLRPSWDECKVARLKLLLPWRLLLVVAVVLRRACGE
ncbi:hypothetical protein PpBr36_03275 [Pyricularia pennisetigena]|uniref:hypothetical protein n=1 Tax=Pyricularia pennisetigena TaxID=1578925 RepID=UPI001154774F|nr:hypothetical protein PpBr36_03275 [Pyricularia pennisetigena]TLS30122.1 hypothetical protein PpBr36_03275 [Pyricularia pennisetigena]